MTDPTTIALARAALSEHAGAVHAYENGFNPLRPRTREATLARALLQAQEEKDVEWNRAIEAALAAVERTPYDGYDGGETRTDDMRAIKGLLRPVAPSEKESR